MFTQKQYEDYVKGEDWKNDFDNLQDIKDSKFEEFYNNLSNHQDTFPLSKKELIKWVKKKV